MQVLLIFLHFWRFKPCAVAQNQQNVYFYEWLLQKSCNFLHFTLDKPTF